MSEKKRDFFFEIFAEKFHPSFNLSNFLKIEKEIFLLLSSLPWKKRENGINGLGLESN